MKLPPMTFAHHGTTGTATALGGYGRASYAGSMRGGVVAAAATGVAPQGIFDSILDTVTGILPNVGCFAKCGSQALGCLHCGTNLTCWAQCAGPVAVNCIQSCL